MGGTVPGLPIVDVLVTALGRVARSWLRLLAIYWLPWLLGTLGLVVLGAVVEDYLRMGQPPGWARNLVWAPFAVMAYVMLLRFMIDGQPPARIANIAIGKETWIAAPIVAAWFISEETIEAAPVQMVTWMLAPADALAYEIDDLVGYVIAFQFAARLLDAALVACCFGLILVIVRSGGPDLSRLWRLLRLYPVRLIYVSFLAVIAARWLWDLGSLPLAWLALDHLSPQGMIPWRANIHRAFLGEILYFPVHFLEFAIKGCIMAEAYRRLLMADRGAAQPAFDART